MAGYVVGDNFQTHLLSTGLIVRNEPEDWWSFFDCDQKVVEAIATFESAAARRYVAAAKVLTFDPTTHPRGVQPFLDDLIQLNSVTLSGRMLSRNVDFFLKPDNSGVDKRPWTWLEFAWGGLQLPQIPALRQSLLIDGLWGYCLTDPPADVNRAILDQAFVDSFEQLSLAISRGLLSWTDGETNTHEEYARYKDQVPLKTEKAEAEKRIARVLAAHGRAEY